VHQRIRRRLATLSLIERSLAQNKSQTKRFFFCSVALLTVSPLLRRRRSFVLSAHHSLHYALVILLPLIAHDMPVLALVEPNQLLPMSLRRLNRVRFHPYPSQEHRNGRDG
jgi:hypothetical protein